MAYNVIEPKDYMFVYHDELNGKKCFLMIEMFDTPCIVKVR